MRGHPSLRSECMMHTSSKAPMLVESTMEAVAVCALQSLMAGPVAVLTIKSWMSIMSPAKPIPPTCPRHSASLGSLPARTTAASKSAGSVMGTTIVWTTVMRPLNSATSTPVQLTDSNVRTTAVSPFDGCVMVTMTVAMMRMNQIPHALLAHAHQTSTLVPVGAASLSHGHVTSMTTVETAQMNQTHVPIQPASL